MAKRLDDMETRLRQIAKRHWTSRLTELGGDAHAPLWRLWMPSRGRQLARVCLAGGMHGDAQASVEAILRLLESGAVPPGVALDCFPCMNTAGFAKGQRAGLGGLDLDRQFGTVPPPVEIQAFLRAIGRERYDTFLALAEDENALGFYVHELPGPAGSLGGELVTALSRRGDRLEDATALRAAWQHDSRPGREPEVAPGLMISRFEDLPRAGVDQATYMRREHAPHALTLVSPARLGYEQRTQALMSAAREVLQRLTRDHPFAALAAQGRIASFRSAAGDRRS